MPVHVPSHYEVLGVPVTANESEIRRAYRRAARAHHPDHGGDVVEFRRVTLAFEVLSDPKARAAYDRSYFTSAPQRESPQPGSAAPTGAGTFTARAAPRSGGQRNLAGEPAVYVPPFAPGSVPLLPAEIAARAEHGVPRRRGLFGADARIQREQRTAALIRRRVLTAIPSARLLNGLRSPADSTHIAHAVLAGYRLALVDSMLVPRGNYAWDGEHLIHGSRVVAPPRLADQVRYFQNLFPELNVQGYILVQTPDEALHEPVIDVRRGAEGLIEPLNAAKFLRELTFFLSSGPQPNVVFIPALARLLTGLH
ncbi:DnaJ domain-containing protein [Sinomonas sp. ASV486]|uniref:J domain-containing protein n=1 Tax=Sinomonas sp. ASV486 TaxID=3051170 RepID=UPI0027DBB543|nr:DnaJ domain-containing protein [Sinomonas sp. ASV486]MDQ4491021.1 DnaJ domain-containing protein [Sinomonas sp. ASV486]